MGGGGSLSLPALQIVHGEVVDKDAVEIGELYRRAKTALVDSVLHYRDCGKRLAQKKASLAHGQWLPWLAANADTLGFETHRTAQLLIKAAANTKSTSHLSHDEAVAISRQTWGNGDKPTLRGASGTGNNQWFTPSEYVELARGVLGSIDLDPASHELAQKTVRAASYFTEETDGLSREWFGRVWLNPPYAQPAIGHFADKMVSEYTAGRVSEAIMLTHNYTDTSWFQKLAGDARAICFTKGRIRFVSPSGELAAPTQGQAFFYFGERPLTFAVHFCGVGFIAETR